MDGGCLWHSGGLYPLALDPVEKFGAARDWSSSGMTSTEWLVFLLLLLVGLAGLAAVAVVVYRKWAAARRQKEAFSRRVSSLDLTDRERYVLRAIAREAGSGNRTAILTSGPAFENGVGALMRSRRVAAVSKEKKKTIGDLIDSLRRKLGFEQQRTPTGPPGGAAPAAQAEKPTIGEGDRLMIVFRGRAETFDVNVTETGEGELVVEPVGPLKCEAGETWLARYSQGGNLWEFDAPVVAAEEGRIRVRLPGQMRFVNRRRFQRVATDKQAHVASLPFWRSQMKLDGEQFVPGKLVEIGGPGLRLEAPVEAKAGQRILVALMFDEGNVVEGVGKVRRVSATEDGGSQLAVELVGLSEEEVALLTHETNAAAHELPEQEAPEQPGQEGGEPPEEEVTEEPEEAGEQPAEQPVEEPAEATAGEPEASTQQET